MEEQLIKRSRFSFFAFGDEISERDFYGKNFVCISKNDKTYLHFELSKGLDSHLFEQDLEKYDTFVFDESFVVNKIITVFENGLKSQKIQLHIRGTTTHVWNLSTIKIKKDAIVLQAFG